MSDLNLLQQLRAVLDAAEPDYVKAREKGNTTAGTRVRGLMQDVKDLAQQLRLEVLALRPKKDAA